MLGIGSSGAAPQEVNVMGSGISPIFSGQIANRAAGTARPELWPEFTPACFLGEGYYLQLFCAFFPVTDK